MANKTVYPYGTGGKLPANIGLVDFTVGGRDKALDAESGKILHEMILERTDMYGKLNPSKYYGPGKTVENDTTSENFGTIKDSSYTQSYVNEWPIDLVNNSYIADFGYGSTQTSSWTIYYYDLNYACLGGAVINPGSDPTTKFTMADLPFPESWSGSEDEYKAEAKFVRIIGWDSTTAPRSSNLYETWTVPQSILARGVTPGEINIFAAVIRTPMLKKVQSDNAEIVSSSTPSPWGIIWPSTYTVGGTPTPVIAMLHGSGGYVAEGCLGYTSSGWVAMRNAYLAAGFAVMDINGYGVSTEADAKSKHWGNPLAIETLDKAFEFLKQNYNVCDKLLLHGTSMGGILAESYTKCFPGKVAGVGLFAPNFLAYSARFVEDSTKYLAWGYADKAAAEADNFKNLTGFIPLNECQIADDNSGVISQFDWSEYDYETRQQILTKKLIDHFPVQVRIWQGGADSSVPQTHSILLYNSLMRGNSPVSLRIVSNLAHELETASEYVRREAVDYFKRFVVQYP